MDGSCGKCLFWLDRNRVKETRIPGVENNTRIWLKYGVM